jgi:hypothetical protein
MVIAVRAPQRGANLMAVYSPPGNPVNCLRPVISRTPRSLTRGARTRRIGLSIQGIVSDCFPLIRGSS